MRIRSRLPVCAVGVLGLAVTGLPADAAEPLACGTTITSSVTLQQDLECPTGSGLIIGASGTADAPLVVDLNGHTVSGIGGPSGIRISGQHDVEVRNGTISGFGAGVDLQQSMRVAVTGLSVDAVYRGINVGGGGYHRIEKNTITAQQQDGIRLGVSGDNVLADNTITDAVWGISVAEFTAGNRVERNVVTGSREHGIGAFGSARGIRLIDNITDHNRDGIAIGRDVTGATLEGNEARHNRDDGIQIDTTSATADNNIAIFNGDLGIEAVQGITATGNHAHDNGAPTQCTGAECTPVP